VLSHDQLLLVNPVNKEHGKAIATLKKAMTVSERSEKALAAAQDKVAVAKAKLDKARANAKTKKTEASKNAVMRGGEAIAKANSMLSEKQLAAKSAAVVTTEAASAVTAGIVKEKLKQKAVMAFADKWEKQYDRKVSAAAKAKAKKAKAKKSSAKKKAVSKKTASKPA